MVRLYFSFCLCLFFDFSVGFLTKNRHPLVNSQSTSLAAATKRQSGVVEVTDETPAEIPGAKFFGGNKQKEELYDQEQEAAESSSVVNTGGFYNRFFSDQSTPNEAFDSLLCAQVASSLQSQINHVLYEKAAEPNTEYSYSPTLNWGTPISKQQTSPLNELEQALGFYKNVDLAIISGKQIDDSTLEFQWELSVVWPTFWSPRVLLVGTSVCSMEQTKIVRQTDTLIDNIDLLNAVSSQVKPRFWDWYHIGMTPSAEKMPKLSEDKKWGYQVYEIPSRIVSVPSITEVGARDERNAQTVPNHAFSCIIKTMGPTRQRYIPTTPVEVQIIPGEGKLNLKWTIPLAVEFLTNSNLPLAERDEETPENCNPEFQYEFHSRRKVATVNYGGNPQDPEISEIRKRLYEKVVKDGLKPKLDENGRPVFFFFQNTVKACYTEEGLGMCVYEWRAKSVKPDEVGIELEFT
jgi:hypothetical protein